MATTAMRVDDRTNGDGVAAAREASLRYVSDEMPGIRRRRAGKGFAYVGPDGRKVDDAETLVRIRSLAVPPAWTEVWICPDPRGHLQATGRDARGRKQYRYHDRWREVRDENKFARLIEFAEALPRIRERVDHDLALPGLPREKVLATVVRLLERTLIRVGNPEYARDNSSYGLTTLRSRHVDVSGSTLTFEFPGKGGRRVEVGITDRRVSRVVKKCLDLPGYGLFQYTDEEGQRRDVESGHVNEYLRDIAGRDFTAKDFRTWVATSLTLHALHAAGPASSQRQAKRKLNRAIEQVAQELGNTPAVARSSYIHPSVIEAYLDGTLVEELRAVGGTRRKRLDREEAQTLAFLKRRTGKRGSGNGRGNGSLRRRRAS